MMRLFYVMHVNQSAGADPDGRNCKLLPVYGRMSGRIHKKHNKDIDFSTVYHNLVYNLIFLKYQV